MVFVSQSGGVSRIFLDLFIPIAFSVKGFAKSPISKFSKIKTSSSIGTVETINFSVSISSSVPVSK